MLYLRNYQLQTKNSVYKYWKQGFKRLLLPMPTRTGKTEVAVSIILDAVQQGVNSMFICHQTQLVNNATERLKKYGLNPFVIQANTPELGCLVYSASKPTLANRAKSKVYDTFFESIKIIIIDEAHISIQQSKVILDKCPNALVLCLTATPYTSKGQGLKDIADFVVPCLTESEARNEGWKVKGDYHTEKNVTINAKKNSTGDYDNKELHSEMKKLALVANPVDKWLMYGKNSTTVVYCVNIEHAHEVAQEFRDRNIPCGVINSDSDAYNCVNEKGIDEPLETVLSRFRAGEFKVLCNIGMLTIGYDLPKIRCILVNLATLSLNKWRQMDRASGVDCYVTDAMGVSGRLYAIANSSKPNSIFIDLGNNLEMHGSHESEIPFSLAGLEKKEKSLPLCPMCGVEMPFPICSDCGFEGTKEDAKKEKSAIKRVEKELVKIQGSDYSYVMAKWLYKPYNELKVNERETMAFCSDTYLYAIFEAKKARKPQTADGYYYMLQLRRNEFLKKVMLLAKVRNSSDTSKIFDSVLEVPEPKGTNKIEFLSIRESINESIHQNEPIDKIKEMVDLFVSL
jgi:hypothetical protein